MSTPTNSDRNWLHPIVDRPITDDWLQANGFRLRDNRNDQREPLRRLAISGHKHGGRTPFESSDDLCIDIAPSRTAEEPGEWSVWLMQVEPYRHIFVRSMRFTWEIARLYEGLTGVVWFGSL